METTATLQAAAEERTRKTRLDYIDIAKGILIFLVVLSHTWFANSDLLGHFLPFSMPAYFFLAGYTYKPGRSYWKSILRRAIGLLIPYILFNCLWNLFLPVYNNLSGMPPMWQTPAASVWMASLRTDALNMLMCTPMWFLVALFTASIIFYAVADQTRESLQKTAVVAGFLVLAALVIDVTKTQLAAVNRIDIENTQMTWWFLDLAPYGAAMMLVGAWCGHKKFYATLNVRNVIIGLVCLGVSLGLNVLFWGSARTSIVKYIDGRAWYGVLTGFVIAVTGTIGTVCVSRILQQVPVVRSIFKWMGRNSIWILCIHYAFIMLAEMWLFNKGILGVSIFDVVNSQLNPDSPFTKPVSDSAKDILIKIGLAVLSILLSAVYALIHNKVKAAIKARREKAAAQA